MYVIFACVYEMYGMRVMRLCMYVIIHVCMYVCTLCMIVCIYVCTFGMVGMYVCNVGNACMRCMLCRLYVLCM